MRATAVLGAILLTAGLSGCSSDASAGPAEAIDALPYIGEGLKSDYKAKIAAAEDEAATDAIVEEATRISAVVGTPMSPFDLLGEMSDSEFTLNEDGTVTATNDRFHALMSYATHWRVGDRTIDLCTDETCEFYSSWDITYVVEQGMPDRYRFTINTNGVEADDAENYRDLLVKK